MIDLIAVSAHDVGGSRVLVPQRVDAERPAPEPTPPKTPSSGPGGWYAEGAEDFAATIDSANEEHRPLLRCLYEWAVDVLLDVSELEVDRITLEVEDLRAHVSVLAELANLVSLSVGVDARLDRVKLEIEGVEAEVLLKVRLKHIRVILEKALDTIAEHPEILRILSRSLGRLVKESLEGAQATLEETLEGLEVGDTVDEALRGKLEEVRGALEDILERQEELGEGVARGALGGAPAGDAASSASEE